MTRIAAARTSLTSRIALRSYARTHRLVLTKIYFPRDARFVVIDDPMVAVLVDSSAEQSNGHTTETDRPIERQTDRFDNHESLEAYAPVPSTAGRRLHSPLFSTKYLFGRVIDNVLDRLSPSRDNPCNTGGVCRRIVS